MVAADEDSLICDFAETYHIYQWRGLAVKYAAVLAFGLSENSRIKMALTKRKVTLDTMLMASAVDALNLLVWMQTKDAQKHRNQPGRGGKPRRKRPACTVPAATYIFGRHIVGSGFCFLSVSWKYQQLRIL